MPRRQRDRSESIFVQIDRGDYWQYGLRLSLVFRRWRSGAWLAADSWLSGVSSRSRRASPSAAFVRLGAATIYSMSVDGAASPLGDCDRRYACRRRRGTASTFRRSTCVGLIRRARTPFRAYPEKLARGGCRGAGTGHGGRGDAERIVVIDHQPLLAMAAGRAAIGGASRPDHRLCPNGSSRAGRLAHDILRWTRCEHLQGVSLANTASPACRQSATRAPSAAFAA